MYPTCRLTEFNHALIYGFDPESPFNIEPTFYAETGQHIDLLNAYLHAQDHILPIIKKQTIDNITEELLLEWILQLHKHTGKHLLTAFNQKSGEYTKTDVIRCQQGMENLLDIAALVNDVTSFDQHAEQFILNYSQQHQLSEKTCSTFVEILKRYRKECLSASFETECALLTVILNKIQKDWRNGTLPLEEKTAFSKIITFCTPPDKISEAMQSFARQTLKTWKTLPGKNIQDIAIAISEIFYHFTSIHPFDNCNGRTATCITNIILKSIDLPDIMLRYPGERNDLASHYEQAMANIDEMREPFANHIVDCITRAQTKPFQNLKLAEIVELRVAMSLRCQALEKSPSFSFTNFIEQAEQSRSQFPSGLSEDELEILALKRALAILDDLESKLMQPTFKEEKNPLVLYKKAIACYQTLRYDRAITLLQAALTRYQEKTGQYSAEVANCYSTQASVYRDNKQFSLAASACDNGINCLEKLNSTETNAIIKKYSECLSLLKQPPSEIYQLAVNNYKLKNYQSARCQLGYCVQQWQSKPAHKKQLGLCYSTMASCQRDAGRIEEALVSCDLAISCFTTDTANLEAVLLKRDNLLNLTSHMESNLKF